VYQWDVILIGCDEDVVPHLRRELQNNAAVVESEFRDVAEALEVLRSTKSKRRLLILQVKAFEGLDQLGRLCAALRNWPVMVLMDAGGEVRIQLNSSYLSAIQMGASQIIGLPLRPEDFQIALDRVAVQSVASRAKESQVIAVAGVTGGCGATSLAINLGDEFVNICNKRCILVELSLKLGVIASHLNLEPTHSLHDLLSNMHQVDETLIRKVLFKIDENFELLPGPDRLVATGAYSSSDVLRLVDLMKPLCDVILLDLPCTYDNLYFEVLAGADQIVLVGEPKVPSIRALKLVHEMVDRDESSESEHLVINRFDDKSSLPTSMLVRILGVTRLHTIMQDVPAYGESANRGCTLRVAAPLSHALAEIGALAKVLLEGEAPAKFRAQRSLPVGPLVNTFA
jgi:pilus assembly protein CpaE